MKITDIKPFPVWVGHRNQMLVKIETDAGIHGWGESGVSGRELAVEGAVKHYGRFPGRATPRSANNACGRRRHPSGSGISFRVQMKNRGVRAC